MLEIVRRWTGGLVALGLFTLIAGAATGCAEQAGTPGPNANAPIGEVEAGLVAFQGCGDLEGYIKGVAIAELEKGYVYYDQGIEPPMAMDMASGEAGGQANGEPNPAPSAPTEGGGEGKGGSATTTGPSHSDTNVQVEGVDEADLVKTDGNFLYVVHGNTLRILKSFPANETAEVSTMALPGATQELFLHGDTLLAYGQAWGGKETGWGVVYGGGVNGGSGSVGAVPAEATPPPAIPTEPAPEPDGGDDADDPPAPASKPGVETAETDFDNLRGGLMTMTFIDVSDRTDPTIVRRIAVESQYAAARMIGSTVYTVARGQMFVDAPIAYGYGYTVGSPGVAVSVDAPPPSDSPSSGSGSSGSASSSSTEVDPDGADSGDDEDAPEPPAGKSDGFAPDTTEPDPALDEWKQAYLEALEAKTLEDLMPRMLDQNGANTSEDMLSGCGGFYKPSLVQGLQTVSLIAIDLANPTAEVAVSTTLGRVGTVFASQDAIYLASYTYDYWYWTDMENKGSGEYSMIHKFSLANGSSQYVASGKIPGQILNQFSMDEHDGHLRVATTQNNWNTTGESSNGLYVLATSGDKLSITGSIEDLALGERVYSARFVGDRGYVVTFKQIDPLFTMDLSNHSAPTVAGELKIPGFSTYIHPLGDNHLLTIGRDVEDNGSWTQIDGVQVQIFDVTDIATPTVAHKESFGSGGTNSEALYDHRAFAYFAEKGLLAVPYQDYGWEGGGGIGVAVPNETSPAEGEPTEEPGGEAPPDSGGSDEPVDTEPPTDEDPVDPDPWTPTAPQAGIKVFSIDAIAGIDELGDITHTDLVDEVEGEWYNYRDVRVRRTLLIEDALYSIGTAGVKVNAASDLSLLASVKFPPEYEYNGGGKDQPTEPVPMPTPSGEPSQSPDEDPEG